MKPKNLKFPYSWQERKPFLNGNLFFVPEYYFSHKEYVFPKWENPSLFGNNHPVHLEYCSGNGLWIMEKAQQFPNINWVALEKKFERVRKIWSKSQNYQLKNLFIICGEALTFTSHYLSENSVSAAYVNFPDPWPKEKHAKNRLFQKPFILELSRICNKDSSVTVVTDEVKYSEQIISEVLNSKAWSSCFPAPYFVDNWPDYGTSYFDSLWREKGKTIYYHQFINRKYQYA